MKGPIQMNMTLTKCDAEGRIFTDLDEPIEGTTLFIDKEGYTLLDEVCEDCGRSVRETPLDAAGLAEVKKVAAELGMVVKDLCCDCSS